MKSGAQAFLAKIALHTPLSAAETEALSGIVGRPLPLKAGETIAALGDPLDTATIVLDGVLARTKTLADGRCQILSLLLPGDVVDPHAAVLRRRDDELIAICNAHVASVPQSRILAVGAEHPRLQEAFLREAFIEAAVVREWVMNIGRRTAVEAMAHLLCELKTRLTSVGVADGKGVPFPLKQHHLADCLGLSLIHVNRVLQQLRADGLIHTESRRLTVLDEPGLQRIAGFSPDYLHIERAKAA